MKELKLCVCILNNETSAFREVFVELQNRGYKELAEKFFSVHSIA